MFPCFDHPRSMIVIVRFENVVEQNVRSIRRMLNMQSPASFLVDIGAKHAFFHTRDLV
jgi:hypothetical protein